jgi:hypothetical protein
VGGTASATVGVGVGANALVGGFNNSIALQPLSIEANRGLNVAAGVAEMTLYTGPLNPSASFLARVGETGDEATRDRIVAGGPDARREVVSTGRVVAAQRFAVVDRGSVFAVAILSARCARQSRR